MLANERIKKPINRTQVCPDYRQTEKTFRQQQGGSPESFFNSTVASGADPGTADSGAAENAWCLWFSY